MERVGGAGFFSYRRRVGGKDDAKRAAGSTGVFDSELERSAESEHADVVPAMTDAETAALLDAVFEAGDRLRRDVRTDTLMAYKETVRRFLSAVVRRGLIVEERVSGSNILKRKRYALVHVIDRKLEQLAAGMVSSQRNQIDLLARIDEINGLIVDLTR